MKYRCPDCGREVDLPPKSHGDGCFSCGSDLRALTASIDGVTVDLALLKEKIEGTMTQGRFAEHYCDQSQSPVSRQLRGLRKMEAWHKDGIRDLFRDQGWALSEVEYDPEGSSFAEVMEDLEEVDEDLDSFPLDEAQEVQRLTREAAEEAEIEATFGFRRLKLWQRAWMAFVNHGVEPRPALGAAYWVAHAYKLEDEDQTFAEEIYQRVFGEDPVEPTEVIDHGPMQAPMEPVALVLAEAGFHLFAYGETGDGKSFGMERVARKISQHPDDRIIVQSGYKGLTPDRFVATTGARGDGKGGTETFTDLRALPISMQGGMPLVLDEPCVIDPSNLMSLQRALENREVYITEADMVVKATPGWQAFLTDNTRGLAEDPRYTTRHVLDEAFRDRFLFLRWQMPQEVAEAILEEDAEHYGKALTSNGDDLTDADAHRTEGASEGKAKDPEIEDDNSEPSWVSL